jgi:hypothetical protein
VLNFVRLGKRSGCQSGEHRKQRKVSSILGGRQTDTRIKIRPFSVLDEACQEDSEGDESGRR